MAESRKSPAFAPASQISSTVNQGTVHNGIHNSPAIGVLNGPLTYATISAENMILIQNIIINHPEILELFAIQPGKNINKEDSQSVTFNAREKVEKILSVREFFEKFLRDYREYMCVLDINPLSCNVSQNTIFAEVMNCRNDKAAVLRIIEQYSSEPQNLANATKIVDSNGINFPLYFISKGFYEIYYKLIEGFFLEEQAVDKVGFNAEKIAIIYQQYEFLARQYQKAKMLTDAKLFLSDRSVLKLNELHIAIICNDIRAVKIIVDSTAHLIAPYMDFFGNIFNLAIIFADYPILQYLLIQSYKKPFSSSELFLLSPTEINAFSLAAALGKYKIVNYFLKFIERVTEIEVSDIIRPAFYLAVQASHFEVMQLLYDYGFKPKKTDFEYANTAKIISDKTYTTNLLGSMINGNYKTNYKFECPKQYLNLTFQPGGMKGVIYPYALDSVWSSLKEKPLIRVAGISAGAAFALGVSLGMKPTEMIEQVNNYDFGRWADTQSLQYLVSAKNSSQNRNRFFDDRTSQHLFETLNMDQQDIGKVAEKFQEIGAFSVSNEILDKPKEQRAEYLALYDQLKKKFFPEILRLNETHGFQTLSEGRVIYEWLMDVMEQKGVKDPTIFTFGDLRNRIKEQKESLCKHLYVIVTCCNTKVPIVLNSEDEEFDDYVILDAVYASTAIPFVFKPGNLVRKLPDGKTKKSSNSFIDGNMLYIDPIDVFDAQSPLFFESTHIAYPYLNNATIGLGFPAAKSAIETQTSIYTILDKVLELCFFTDQEKYKDRNSPRTIFLDTGEVHSVSFKKFDNNEKEQLKKNAMDAVVKYFSVTDIGAINCRNK